MPVRTFELTPNDRLVGDVDVEHRVAQIPDHFSLKGLFFDRLVASAGPGWKSLPLKGRPALGRYLPWNNYPQADYTRLVVAAASIVSPDLPAPQAIRRLAAEDFRTFAATAMGRVAVSLLGDPEKGLMRMPRLYEAVLSGGFVRAQRLGACHIRFILRRFFGFVECYVPGQIEGMLATYGETKTKLVVTVSALDEADIDICWGLAANPPGRDVAIA
jgi:uncharacterized protein (TIGR02265 family)